MDKETVDELVKHSKILIRGFETGIFIRSIEHDYDSAWAIKLLPYVRALAVVQAICDKDNASSLHEAKEFDL